MRKGPEYGRGEVSTFLLANEARYVADGMPLQEVRRAEQQVRAWQDWWPHWMERSAWFERRADDSGVSPTTQTSLLVTASLAAHWAQYLHFHDEEERFAALHQKIRTHRRAIALVDPPGEVIRVPFEGTTLPAVLRRPRGVDGPVPCVIYVGGLDAHKEDAFAFVELCLMRGLAVLAYDGPGQGEARLEGLLLDPVSHLGVSAAIDALSGRPDVDPERIGVVGRSLGGFLAPRAAADDDRIAALCVWGAMYHLGMLGELPRHTRDGFCHVTGSANLQVAGERLRFIQLRGAADRIACPVLIVHGSDDALTPVSHAEALASDIGPHCDLRVVPGSGHCNHDVAHVVRPAMADWLAQALNSSEGTRLHTP